MNYEIWVDFNPEIVELESPDEIKFRNYALTASYAVLQQAEITEDYMHSLKESQFQSSKTHTNKNVVRHIIRENPIMTALQI